MGNDNIERYSNIHNCYSAFFTLNVYCLCDGILTVNRNENDNCARSGELLVLCHRSNETYIEGDFMFQLTEDEKAEVVAKCDHLRTMKYSPNLPYVFTEHGAVMLASVLNSERAIEVNVRIVKLFNAMREVLRTNQTLLLKLEKIDKHLQGQNHTLMQHNEEIGVLFELIDELRKENEQPPVRNPIGFKPQPIRK